MKTCATCKHWRSSSLRLPAFNYTEDRPEYLDRQACGKIMEYDRTKLIKNDAADLAFVDAEWGLLTAPTFGCVLHEEKVTE